MKQPVPKLPDLSHIGSKEDDDFRNYILDSHPSLSLILAHDYRRTFRNSGKVAANRRLHSLHKRLNNSRFPGLKLTSDDDSIKSACKLKAGTLEDKIKQAYRSKGWKEVKRVAAEFLALFDLEIPVKKLVSREPTETEWMEAISKASGARWWRKKIRTRIAREREQLLRELGQVSASKGGYVSSYALRHREGQRVRNQSNLELMQAVNQYGDEFVLAELAEKTVSNPAIRRNELIVRVKGLAEQAKKLGYIGFFFTQTTPSRFHPMKKNNRQCFRNANYEEGLTPKDGQAQLMGVWSRVRAEWDREDIRVFGVCVTEPHHDGTPHWHSILFVHPSRMREMVSIYRRHVCAVDRQDLVPRAVTHRFKGGWVSYGNSQKVTLKTAGIQPRFDWKIMKGKDGKPDPMSAVAYVLKYICKNIDGAGMDGKSDDETDGFIKDSCIRVEAWAALWGIRQFRQIGGATVGVYRELRKVKEEDFDHWQQSIPHDDRMTSEEMKKDFLKIREASDKGEYGTYTDCQGGAEVRRKFHRYKNWKIPALTSTENEEQIKNLFGVVVSSGREVVKGIETAGKAVLSRFYQWTVVFGKAALAASQGAGTAPSRTCVNNCTEPATGRYLH